MADTEATDDSTATESKTQREARLRRERRNAKIQAGGSERLNKITSMSGRPAAAEAELNKSIPSTSTAPEDDGGPRQPDTQDPAEIDISQMFRKPTDDPNQPSQQEMLRRMLRERDPNQEADAAGGEADDPMVRMMQQMLGGEGQGQDQDLSKMAELFGKGPEEQEKTSGADYMWRIVHAIFSILLGLYAVSFFTFTGSEISRQTNLEETKAGPRLFLVFATAELVLQSTRYFVDKGQLPASSMLAKVAQFLPEPYAGYVRVLRRYSVIYTTIMSDILVILFILGAMAWWRGLTAE